MKIISILIILLSTKAIYAGQASANGPEVSIPLAGTYQLTEKSEERNAKLNNRETCPDIAEVIVDESGVELIDAANGESMGISETKPFFPSARPLCTTSDGLFMPEISETCIVFNRGKVEAVTAGVSIIGIHEAEKSLSLENHGKTLIYNYGGLRTLPLSFLNSKDGIRCTFERLEE